MCVAVPGRVVSIDEGQSVGRPAVVAFADRTLSIDLVMTPEVRVGDWIVAHSGYAIRRVTSPHEPATFTPAPNQTHG